jgi:serine protease Do
MTRRFLITTIGLSATVAFLVGLVVAGTMSPARALSATTVRPRPVPAAPTRSLPSSEASFADIAERLNPTVVSIDATSRGSGRLRRRDTLEPRPPLADPLQPEPGERGGPRFGTGAGFIIDATGAILTNHHVVDGAERINVRLADGRTLRATAVGSDLETDIALLQVESPDPLPVAPLGDSDTLRVGEWVVAIGNPLSYEHTVTVGVVSFIGRKLFDTSLDRYIQTDAAINFGNSGGPLISAHGEVIGINAAISSRASNIGFAVPINQAKAILAQLRDTGHVSRGYIGVMLRDVDVDLQLALGLSSADGALVQDVIAGSPGARAGLQTYDVIVALDDEPIDGNDSLVQSIAARQPGSTASVQVVRDGRPMRLTLKLAERPQRERQTARVSEQPSDRRGSLLGLSVREVDARTSARFGLPEGARGVVVSGVEPMSPAFDADIARGHLLLEVNREPVQSAEDFRRLTDRARPGDIYTVYLYKPELNQRALETLKIDQR